MPTRFPSRPPRRHDARRHCRRLEYERSKNPEQYLMAKRKHPALWRGRPLSKRMQRLARQLVNGRIMMDAPINVAQEAAFPSLNSALDDQRVVLQSWAKHRLSNRKPILTKIRTDPMCLLRTFLVNTPKLMARLVDDCADTQAKRAHGHPRTNRG
jgi:hypothetical protein